MLIWPTTYWTLGSSLMSSTRSTHQQPDLVPLISLLRSPIQPRYHTLWQPLLPQHSWILTWGWDTHCLSRTLTDLFHLQAFFMRIIIPSPYIQGVSGLLLFLILLIHT